MVMRFSCIINDLYLENAVVMRLFSDWGTSGIYERGVGHPIRLLRQAIEPDPKNPIYIETVYRIGYRFTAKRVEKRRTKL